MAISSTRARATRSSSLFWRMSSSWLRGGEESPFCGGRLNQAGGSLAAIHSDASGHSYKVAVVGAGPAGLAILATLLDIGTDSILWIDPHFDAGRLSTYPEVPSNTKVKLFQQYVTTSPSLNRYAAPALAHFASHDPDRGCSLHLAARMVKSLTNSVRQQNQVHSSQRLVKQLQFRDSKWHLDTGEVVEQVYLATGSAPDSTSVKGVHHIDLDSALTPSMLPGLVSESDTVGVVGSSHSAMLALRNLVDCKPHKIINFYRSPLLYAQHMEDWILYDNTGLKGEVAEWARHEVDSGSLESKGILTRVCVKERTREEQVELWRGCTKLVQAVGFTRNALPRIFIGGQEVEHVEYDPRSGRIADGLFGYGIAFPERVTDPHGNRELAVGMWKFMRYARETVPKHSLHFKS